MPTRNPYRGLEAFEQADADDFYGRDRAVAEMVAVLGQERLLVVVGPSGIGKSSVVKAGLAARARGGAVAGSESWLVTEMVPGREPFEQLAAALERVATVDPARRRRRAHVARRARSDDVVDELVPPDTGRARRRRPARGAVHPDGRRQRATGVPADAGGRGADARLVVRLVATLRADYFDRPLGYPGFGDAIRGRTVALGAMTAAELADAVRLPAAGGGRRDRAGARRADRRRGRAAARRPAARAAHDGRAVRPAEDEHDHARRPRRGRRSGRRDRPAGRGDLPVVRRPLPRRRARRCSSASSASARTTRTPAGGCAGPSWSRPASAPTTSTPCSASTGAIACSPSTAIRRAGRRPSRWPTRRCSPSGSGSRAGSTTPATTCSTRRRVESAAHDWIERRSPMPASCTAAAGSSWPSRGRPPRASSSPTTSTGSWPRAARRSIATGSHGRRRIVVGLLDRGVSVATSARRRRRATDNADRQPRSRFSATTDGQPPRPAHRRGAAANADRQAASDGRSSPDSALGRRRRPGARHPARPGGGGADRRAVSEVISALHRATQSTRLTSRVDGVMSARWTSARTDRLLAVDRLDRTGYKLIDTASGSTVADVTTDCEVGRSGARVRSDRLHRGRRLRQPRGCISARRRALRRRFGSTGRFAARSERLLLRARLRPDRSLAGGAPDRCRRRQSSAVVWDLAAGGEPQVVRPRLRLRARGRRHIDRRAERDRRRADGLRHRDGPGRLREIDTPAGVEYWDLEIDPTGKLAALVSLLAADASTSSTWRPVSFEDARAPRPAVARSAPTGASWPSLATTA